jgi:hypothetical protein
MANPIVLISDSKEIARQCQCQVKKRMINQGDIPSLAVQKLGHHKAFLAEASPPCLNRPGDFFCI